MPAQINMISTRPNTNADFWWTTTDPTVVSIRNGVAAVFQENNVPSVQTISSDGLTCTMTYTVEQEGAWATLVGQTKTREPNIITNRRGYHEANNHTLKLEVRGPDNELIKEVQVVPAP
jgi:hypothetical protein